MNLSSFFRNISTVFLFLCFSIILHNQTVFAGSTKASFSDISIDHTLYDEIDWVYKHGIVKGYSDGTFRPHQTITRAEFTKMLLLSKYASWSIKEKPSERAQWSRFLFPDVSPSDWFDDYVYFAEKEGIIGGYPDGTFGPYKNVNFAEASKIISFLHFPEEFMRDEYQNGEHWYSGYFRLLEEKDISLHPPTHNITRGEMATILFSIYGNKDDTFPENETERADELENILILLKDGDKDEYSHKYNIVKELEELNGKTLYVFSSMGNGPGPGPNIIIYFYDSNTGIEIVGELGGNSNIEEWRNHYANGLSISDIMNTYNITFGASLPDQYNYPEKLEFTPSIGEINQKTWIPFYDNSTFELNPYLLKTGIFHPEYGEIFTDKKNALILRGNDFVTRKYSVEIPFLEDGQIARINWNNTIESDTNSSEYRKGYTYQDQGGCGSTNYASVITPEQPANFYTASSENITPIYINPETDFIQTGVGINGEVIYELSDPFHPFLLEMYNVKYFEYFGEKIPYEEFLSVYPVFFWKDNFGRWIKFESNRFIPQAECGKPVVYLYPEEETEVHVHVAPQGGFSITIPEHGEEGWFVIAQPDGSLTEISTQEEYPYLFWEGTGGIYESPNKGWVIPKTDADFFVAGKLRQFGFNSQEIIDFLEFWSPRLQEGENDFLWISFWGTEYMNAIAPITITPKPDSLLRVLMDYKEVPEWYESEGYKIPSFTRKGFVVTEWGGTLWTR